MLKSLKEDAEAALGLPVSEAVISVPAYFDDPQRRATREAAQLAGLSVRRLINEPTAAALAYGLAHRDRELRAVVLDLGGGTFDVTVLEIIEGVIEIQSSAGDTRLGGDDFTSVLARAVAERAREEHGLELEGDPVLWSRTLEAADRAKVRLSTAAEADVFLPLAPPFTAAPLEVQVTLSRDLAEELWQPLLDRLEVPLARALGDARLSPDRIDEVLLVGGATRMPCFVRFAAQKFGRMPRRHLPPDEAVALGAAVQAGLEAQDHAVEDLVVTDVAPFTLGIATSEKLGSTVIPGIYSPILERGTVIPASRSGIYSTIRDGQTEILLEVYQGEHSLVKDNRRLGQLRVPQVPPAPGGEQGVEVRFTYDPSGILEVEAMVLSTSRKSSVVLEEAPGQHSAEQMERTLKGFQSLKFHPRDALPNTTALARAEALFVELTGERREALATAMTGLRAALEAQDEGWITRQRESLLALLERMR